MPERQDGEEVFQSRTAAKYFGLERKPQQVHPCSDETGVHRGRTGIHCSGRVEDRQNAE